ANRVLLKDMSLIGVFWGSYIERFPQYFRDIQADLFRMYEAGQVKPVVSHSWPLDQAIEALAALGARRTYGKVVLTMN
ncbi:MAG: zinc-binding dehydrogenase, partial [Blastocatellia bacterium]